MKLRTGQCVKVTEIKYLTYNALADTRTKEKFAWAIGRLGRIKTSLRNDWYEVNVEKEGYPSPININLSSEEFEVMEEDCNSCKIRFKCWTE